MIDVYASQPNYWRHLAPIVRELCRRGHEVRTGASSLGRPWGDRLMRAPETDLLIVASWTDARRWPWVRCAYVEHGAGQTYVTGTDGYAGAPKLDHVVLFLAPNDRVTERWRASYPEASVETVGCAALDALLCPTEVEGSSPSGSARGAVAQTGRADGGNQSVGNLRGNPSALTSVGASVVAVTSHWFCSVVPETMPVLHRYESALRSLCDAAVVTVVGHAHPRAERRTSEMWKRLGVDYEPDPDYVLRTADLLIADNTSLMYEAAAIDLPVLALNLPYDAKRQVGYRRDVEHGLRFWSHVPGLQCDDPADLERAVHRALDDRREARQLRARAAAHAYAHRDGTSAARAADAIERVL